MKNGRASSWWSSNMPRSNQGLSFFTTEATRQNKTIEVDDSKISLQDICKKKSQRNSGSDGQTDDDDDDDEDDDLCLRLSHLFKRAWEAMKEQQALRNKSKDENESYVLQRLKDSAMKLMQDQLYSLVEYHPGHDKVIRCNWKRQK